jgi:hypothetical protein
MPVMKISLNLQQLGVGEGVTRSLLRAIMAPSFITARMTIKMVGKYLRGSEKNAKIGAGCY